MHVCPKCFGLYGSDQGECPKDGVPTQHYTEVLVGLNLGPYVVRSMVSEGGMGVVYAAEHPALGRRVAVKVLRPELSLRDDIVERFAQEARAVNTIGHANIVSIYDFGRTPFGTFYIVMEYLEGRTLRHLLDHGGPQPLERVRFILQGIGEALAAAHAKGFVHRDVKPENIMIGRRGGTDYVKLLDFGIVKLLTGNATTATSGAMGTPMYMSPEQLDDGQLDNRSDTFSLGGVVYELLTGQVPYPGTSHAAVRQAQLTRLPPPTGIIRRDIHISESVDHAISRAIALDPSLRYQKIEDFLVAFQKGYDNTLAEQTKGVGRRGERSSTGGKVFLLATLVALLLGGAVAALLLKVLKTGGGAIPTVVDAGLSVDAGAPDVRPSFSGDWRAQSRQHFAAALKGHQRSKALDFARHVAPKGARDKLLEVLQNVALRKEAAAILGRLGPDPKTLSALTAALRQTTSPFTKATLYGAMGAMGTAKNRKDCARGLEKLLRRHSNQLFQRAALPMLVRCNPKTLGKLRKLEKSIPTDAPQAKIAALRALATVGTAADRKKLLQVVSESTLELQLLAAEAYSELPKAHLDDLQEPLRSLPSKRGDIRARVAGIRARLGDAKGIESLLSSWTSKDNQAKTWSALEFGRLMQFGQLGENRQRSIREALTLGLKDPGPEVSLAAAVALLAF
ncbi:MAG: protein kinase [Deltaproteobacteria bacterium]|nr:protein kinase [Deltaproteobacteria bacterium]